MERKTEKMLIKDYMGMILKAENYQRTQDTGSHDMAYKRKLMTECATYSNHFCGTVKVAELENGIYAVVDGNSRFHDFKEIFNDEISIKYDASEVSEDGSIKNVKKSATYSELPEYMRRNIDSADLDVTFCYNLTLEERARLFNNENNGKAMSAFSKAGVIQADTYYTACEMLLDFLRRHEAITKANELNDVHKQMLAQIVANAKGCYSSGNKTLAQNIAGTDVDLERFKLALDTLETSEYSAKDKYELITLISILYQSDSTVAEIATRAGIAKGFNNCDYRIADLIGLYTPNCLHCSFDTAGANSAVKNAERFKKALAKVKSFMQENYIPVEDESEQHLTLEQLAELGG